MIIFQATGRARLKLSVAIVAVSLLVSVAGCSNEWQSLATFPSPPKTIVSRPIRTRPLKGRHVEVASWYGPGFNGHLTSTGERFNQSSMTAASRTLPLGSRVLVRNPENGRSVEVRINDRGPYVRGRTLDLSKRAAEKLGIKNKGVARVVITPVRPKSRHATADASPSLSSGVPVAESRL